MFFKELGKDQSVRENSTSTADQDNLQEKTLQSRDAISSQEDCSLLGMCLESVLIVCHLMSFHLFYC